MFHVKHPTTNEQRVAITELSSVSLLTLFTVKHTKYDMKSKFYDGTKLLSMKDINGKAPEIYICESNRTAGKTTWFNRYLVNKWLTRGERFLLIYRKHYELSNCDESFFSDIQRLFFPDHDMEKQSMFGGGVQALLLDGYVCGYATYLNASGVIKKFSHLLSSVDRMLFDEAQADDNEYLEDEITKLIRIHTSVARGNGKMVRYVPIYMPCNSVSIVNPYYCQLGITKRLKKDTKYLRGDGWVLERTVNEAAKQAQMSSGFNRAFASNKYVQHSAMNVYLDDNTAFVAKVDERTKYMLNFKSNNKMFSIRCGESGMYYVHDRVDETFPVKVVTDVSMHAPDSKLMGVGSMYIKSLRDVFNRGFFRFKDIECKNAFLDLIAY